MSQGKKRNRIRQIFDILILLCSVGLVICFSLEIRDRPFMPALMAGVIIGMIWALYDFFRVFGVSSKQQLQESHKVHRLILLDGQAKAIRVWDLQGRTSLIIGKGGQSQELDVDLSDCEYSSFIDFQHAALNFCLDQWYVEDLESQNGVKVRKVEDGECYRVIHRPCRVEAGDILYIANTKLLLT